MKRNRKLSKCILCGVLCLAVLLCGCNTKNNDDDSETEDGFNPYPYQDLSVFMDVPDYKNIVLKKDFVDKMYNSEIASLFRQNELDEIILNDTVKEWDTVDISFTGYIDGQAFPGGQSDSYCLTIGSDTFIDGFEDGIIGMAFGEVRDIELKFPDDYGASEYAGKDVTFNVKVNNIYRVPQITDAFCREHTRYDSAATFTETVRNSCIFRYTYDLLISKCEIKKYPDKEYTEYYQYFSSNFRDLAKENGMEFASFISEYGGEFSAYGLFKGMTVADFENVATNYAKSNLVNDLLTYSIIRLENIQTSGAEYDAALKNLEKERGMTYDQLVEQTDEKTVIISVLNIRLSEVLNSYVTVE